jgi:O-antigen/teichoic acid export membrane protein
MAWWLRPRVARVRAHAGELVRDARSFGLSMYLGRILSIGTYSMDVLMLGIFADARVVGFYTLAGSIAALLSSTLGGVASALFPKMVKDESVSRRWVMLVSVAGGAGLLVLVLASRLLIGVAFSARYDAAAALILPLGIAAVIRAVTMLYNLLLQARGQGRELRNAGLALTVSNVVLNFALIPPLKAWGAAWASVGALVVNLLVHILYAHRPHGLVKPATMVSTLTPDRQVHHRGLT